MIMCNKQKKGKMGCQVQKEMLRNKKKSNTVVFVEGVRLVIIICVILAM